MSVLSEKLKLALNTRKLIKENNAPKVELSSNDPDGTCYAGTALERFGHSHNFVVDNDGNGKTSVVNGHYHMIESYYIIPSDMDAHDHDLELQEAIEAETSIGYTFFNKKGEKKTIYPSKPHTHSVNIDKRGRGTTNKVFGHVHQIQGFKILPSEDGHSHYSFDIQTKTSSQTDPWDLGV